MNVMESQWRLRQEFPNGGKAIVEQILESEEIIKSKKSRIVTITYKDLGRKVNHLSKVV